MELGIYSKNLIRLMGQGSFHKVFRNGQPLCNFISELCKDIVRDEAPKSCLISHRYYSSDFYESFDKGKKYTINPSNTELTKEDILKEQTSDVRSGYKFALTDSLINFGRLDENIDVVFPIHISNNIPKIRQVLNQNLGIKEVDTHFRIPEKLEGLLLIMPSLAPSM